MVPHRGTNWAAPWLTSQIGRDAVLSRSYGRGYLLLFSDPYVSYFLDHTLGFEFTTYHRPHQDRGIPDTVLHAG